MRPEESRHARFARDVTSARGPYRFTWCWGVCEAELHYDWAVYHAICADRDAMLAALRTAGSYGWRALSVLDGEPAFACARDDEALRALEAELRCRPRLLSSAPSAVQGPTQTPQTVV